MRAGNRGAGRRHDQWRGRSFDGEPRLESHFHYRNVDVSSLKELVKRWKPELAKGFAKDGKHQALADIYDSLEELRYYRRTVFNI